MTLLKELEGFFLAQLAIIRDTYTLVKLEMALAGQNIFPLLLCFALLIPLFSMVWITLMAVLGYFILPFIGKVWLVLLIILLLNGCLLLLVLRKMKKHLKEMSFSRTRACLSASPREENHDIAKGTTSLD